MKTEIIINVASHESRIAILEDGNLVEILEYPVHPFFIAVQFHPELKSRPTNPHPLFTSFVAAAVEYGKK